MLPRHQDPIVAIATAPGRGAVGIVRVSGRGLGSLVQALCGKTLKPREASYGPLRDADGSAIDHGLALHFPAPHSYTGEDVLELQAHGGPVVLQLLLARCLAAAAEIDPATAKPRLPGLRLAQPGEFTERAFLNDKIDLAQAEAIADLIDASTEAAARSASRSLAGEFSREVGELREALIHLRMLVEATLDFPEEEIDFLQKADAQGQLDRLQARLGQVMQRTRQGALLREGEQVDEVERIGIARAWGQIEAADAVLLLHDLTRVGQADYDAAEREIAATLESRLPARVPVIDVWNKADACLALDEAVAGGLEPASGHAPHEQLRLSARTGAGLDALRKRLLELAGWQGGGEGLYIARERHVQALRQVGEHLEVAALHIAQQAASLDLLAEELRLAQNALNVITGAFSSDDLLGVIFSSFCIGK